jgi:hypothetical protein
VVGGKTVVREGELQSTNVPALVERHNRASKRLLQG